MVLELKHVAQGVRRRSSSSGTSTCTSSAAIAIALVGPNGAGKSTLMRMLVGRGGARRGRAARGAPGRHAVLRAGRGDAHRPEADRLRDARVGLAASTWCRRSATSSAASSSRATTSTSVCAVLSGGERTRLAVARMLLRPSNTLLLDEPTNHLDLDSKDVLLDALVDYGGTLIFVSHDRYFVERLATKIIEIGDGDAVVYPGHLRRVPLAPSNTTGTRGRRSAQRGSRQRARPRRRASRARRSAPRRGKDRPAAPRERKPRRGTTRHGAPEPPTREEEARRRRRAASAQRAEQARAEANRRPRGPHRRHESGHARDRARDGRARLLRRPRRRPSRSSTATRPSCGRSAT